MSRANIKRIESVHYQAVRLICHDYRQRVSREIIDHDFKRATPLEWADYSSARELLHIFNSGKPTKMFERLQSQSYTVRRPSGITIRVKAKSARNVLSIGLWELKKNPVRHKLLNYEFRPQKLPLLFVLQIAPETCQCLRHMLYLMNAV